MPTLDEDIARIAALRGRSAEPYVAAAHQPPRLTRPAVMRILTPNPHPQHDIAFFDALPAKSREFIRGREEPLNAMWWTHLLHETKDEDAIIKAVLYCLDAT